MRGSAFPCVGGVSGAPREGWQLLWQPNWTRIENKGGVLALGAGSGKLYLRWGGLQQVGTNERQKGGFGEVLRGQGLSRGDIANGGARTQDPCARHGWGCRSTIRPRRPPHKNWGLWKDRRGLCKGQHGTAKQEKPLRGEEDMATGVPCPRCHTVTALGTTPSGSCWTESPFPSPRASQWAFGPWLPAAAGDGHGTQKQ